MNPADAARVARSGFVEPPEPFDPSRPDYPPDEGASLPRSTEVPDSPAPPAPPPTTAADVLAELFLRLERIEDMQKGLAQALILLMQKVNDVGLTNHLKLDALLRMEYVATGTIFNKQTELKITRVPQQPRT